MKCNDVRENISLYIDDQLDYEESEVMRNHLNSCESCFNEYEAILKNKSLLNELPNLPLPEGFREELHKKLLKEKRRKNLKNFNWKRYGLIAALLLIAVVSVVQQDFVFNKNGSQQDMAKSEESAPNAAAPMLKARNNSEVQMKSLANDKIMEMADVDRAEDDESMHYSIAGKGESMMEETIENNTAFIIEGSLEDLDEYMKGYEGSIDLSERLFQAELDSSTVELEVILPQEEFNNVANFLKEYSQTVDYFKVEDVVITDGNKEGLKADNLVVILMIEE